MPWCGWAFSSLGVLVTAAVIPKSLGAVARVSVTPATQRLLHDPASFTTCGLVSPGAQATLIVTLSDRHALYAQDVVGRDGVEKEIGQRV